MPPDLHYGHHESPTGGTTMAGGAERLPPFVDPWVLLMTRDDICAYVYVLPSRQLNISLGRSVAPIEVSGARRGSQCLIA